MNFQKLTLVVAGLILVVALIVIAISLSRGNRSQAWPPIVGDCPDYWVDLKGNGEACANTHSLGKCNLPQEGKDTTMNFNQGVFTGSDGTCNKYKWATACGVTWDGITSGVKNPCDTSDSP
jgi:hypothetical protein